MYTEVKLRCFSYAQYKHAMMRKARQAIRSNKLEMLNMLPYTRTVLMSVSSKVDILVEE